MHRRNKMTKLDAEMTKLDAEMTKLDAIKRVDADHYFAVHYL